MPYNFNNTQLKTPVTASYIDDSGMDAPGRKLLGNVLALVGFDAKLAPNTITRLNSYADAKSKLTRANTNVLKAIQKAFNPSKEALAPDYIQFVRIGPVETNATATFNDTTGTPIPALTLTSKVAGNEGEVKVVIGAGTAVNGIPTKKVTVDGTSADRVYLCPLTVSFAANGAVLTDATIAVSRAAVTIAALGTGAVTKTIDITGGLTMAQLISKINAFTGVTGVTAVIRPLAKTNSAKLASVLDCLAATPVTATPTPLKLYGMTQAIVDIINGQFGEKLTAVREDGEAKAVANAELTLVYTPAADQTITLDHWADGLVTLEEIDVQWVVPLSDDAMAHGAVSTHCDYMSSTAFMERRAIVGVPVGTTSAAAIGASETLGSDRVSLVHQGFYDAGVLYPPYVLAALLGGMMCGLTPGTAMTNKTINVSGLDYRLKNPTDTDVLLEGGVLCCWQDFAGNVKVLQSITTAVNSGNFNQREMSVGVASDYVARAIRETLDPLRGKKNTPYLSTEVLSRVESRLKQLAIDEPLGEGVLVGDAKNPAYRGITVTAGADSITVEFECSPVIPCNYIGIVVHTIPYIG